jgi:hypothetical protein
MRCTIKSLVPRSRKAERSRISRSSLKESPLKQVSYDDVEEGEEEAIDVPEAVGEEGRSG